MDRWANIQNLYALLSIPFFMLWYLLIMYWKRKALKQFGSWELIRKLTPDLALWRQYLKYGLMMLILALLILASARPQVGSKLEKGERKGIDLFICLDVSNSMLAEDIKPNRLDRAINAISKMVDELKNDRIGIIVFAGNAYKQLPLTTDYAAAKLFLSNISPDLVPVQGTAIGEAISLARNSFDENKHSKAIIVVTDGENHEADPLEAAKEASESGIRVFTVGMGLPEGAPIPVYQGDRMVGYKQDPAGNPIITKLNDAMLQQIAATSKGSYVRANNTQQSLEKIFDEIGKMQKTVFEARTFTEYEESYQYLLGLAIALIIIELLILERRNRLLSKIKLFE